MTMKTMTMAAAVLALSMAGAATPLEIGKKVNLMKKETWQGVVTQANIQEVYDALSSNSVFFFLFFSKQNKIVQS